MLAQLQSEYQLDGFFVHLSNFKLVKGTCHPFAKILQKKIYALSEFSLRKEKRFTFAASKVKGMGLTAAMKGVEIKGELKVGYDEILTPDALALVVKLHRALNPRRKELLEKRQERQREIDNGTLPDFLSETAHIRNSEWTVAPLPEDLLDRRVEITGPVDRKMVINALNSGAKMFMADFEDSNSPSWDNNVTGQINLRDANTRTISYENEAGKKYALNDTIATLLVRPRGWHLLEKGLLIDGEPCSGGLFDFGLYFFHNVHHLLENGSGPYFYLPKMESHLEARLWNDAFVMAQDVLGIAQGTIKATVLIETILATFELHEILWELKDHSAGLNCGRWDYIFSYIKRFRNNPDFLVPNRDQVTMASPFMDAYSRLVIQTCHKRGVHAMGGMAAFIPIKGDEAANAAAVDKVKNDKLREVKNGHDGTWVAHPGLVSVAMDVFNANMPTKNQINVKREGDVITQADLLAVPKGTITEEGVRKNINVGILYLESWLRGNGAAAIYNLMEDAATAEISRTQVWQWIKHHATLEDGRTVTLDLVLSLIPSELEKIEGYVGKDAFANGKFPLATDLFKKLISQGEFEEFLTLGAYNYI
jgi:malate synthase